MIKKIAVLVTMFLANFVSAQENTASPYSFYGIGSAKFKGTNDIVNMGGISVYSDSTHVNLLNPASYSNQLLTNFQVGFTSSFYKLSTNTAAEKAKKTSFDYMVLGFPITKKLGMSVGLLPQSSVGYRFVSSTVSGVGTSGRYLGNGGVNKFYLGSGFKLNSKLSVGLDLQYLFGVINTEASVFKQGVYYGTKETNESSLSGFAINTGITYATKINSKLNFTSNLVYSPGVNINSSNVRNLSLISLGSNGGVISVTSDSQVNVPNSKLKLPSKLTFGAGVGNRKWFFGGDVVFTGAGSQVKIYNDNANVTFENATKIAFGGFIIPKFDSYSNYLARITYRGGFKYENTGLVVNGTSVKDKSVTLGLGLPISGTFSSLNLGVEYGARGVNSNGLIKEDYLSVNIGLLFNEKWFRKTLYN